MSSAMEDHLRTMSLAALAEQWLHEINATSWGETHDDQCWVEVLRRATVQRDEAACEVIEYHEGISYLNRAAERDTPSSSAT